MLQSADAGVGLIGTAVPGSRLHMICKVGRALYFGRYRLACGPVAGAFVSKVFKRCGRRVASLESPREVDVLA